MKLLLGNHIENAIEAMRVNRWRTAFTITGIVIAAASITAMLSLAGGAAAFFSSQVAKTTDSVALVRSGSHQISSETLLTQMQSLPTTSTLTETDASSLSIIQGASVTPISTLPSTFKSRDGETRGTLVGSNTNLQKTAALRLEVGDFLADNSSSAGVVLGSQLSIDLFGTENSIGNILTVRGETFTVIGVLEPKKEPINYLGVDFDRSAIVTLPAIKQFTQKVAQIQQIAITSSENLSGVISEAQQIITKNHHGENDFFIASGKDIVALNNQLFSALVVTVIIITSIALILGGVGIMNIMLVNAAERQREIGIRKAIGATRGTIVSQFLIEASIIGLIGGFAGYLLGIVSSFVIGMYLPFSIVIQWQVATLSISMAVLTAVMFGLYPAIRAANKNPIEALNH